MRIQKRGSSIYQMFRENLKRKEYRFVFVTKPLIARKFFSVCRAALFDELKWQALIRLNIISFLSLIKSGFSCWFKERYVLIFNPWSTGYYHWITESAIKLMLFKEDVEKSVVIIPGNTPSYIKECLQLSGITTVRELNRAAFIKNLSIITNPVSGHPNPEHLRLFREFIFSKLPVPPAGPEKIYISRKQAKNRKVLNEDEVMELLEKYGFRYVELESMPWIEQVQLFRNCKTVVSIHGAGLTNIIFMPVDGNVIELYPDSGTGFNPCYKILCDTVGLNHILQLSERTNLSGRPDFHTDNIKVSLQEVEKNISQFISIHD